MSMHIIFPGPRTTIQDNGRLGYQNSGFAPSGFIDRVASRMANALVDNKDSEAVLEFCFMGPVLRFDEEVNIAVCGGDFGIDVDGTMYGADRAVHVPAGATVRITTGTVGIYGSLAVGGGLDIPLVMGSRSTNLRCGIGGYMGRALMAGDMIGLRHPENGKQDLSWRWVPARKLVSLNDTEITKVRVIPGPQEDMFTEKGIRTFYESSYEVTTHSDRMGYRLKGPEVESFHGCDILSDGIVNGSIQIAGTGEPIVMMADRQTTGGYAKIASIINVDIPLFAQLRPGQKVRFVRCTVQEAQRLIREVHQEWTEHRRKLDEEKLAREKREAELHSQTAAAPVRPAEPVKKAPVRTPVDMVSATGPSAAQKERKPASMPVPKAPAAWNMPPAGGSAARSAESMDPDEDGRRGCGWDRGSLDWRKAPRPSWKGFQTGISRWRRAGR